ncbi:MAG: hypothetical protein U9N59_11975 [Campylobacterota bacterium]|nr:hypothetical protein [Campylobacterota bacterium]
MPKFLAILLCASFAFANDTNHMYTMMSNLTQKNTACQQSLLKSEQNKATEINKIEKIYSYKTKELEKKLKLANQTIANLKKEIENLRIAQPKTKIVKKIIYRDITSPECKKTLLKKEKLTLPPKLDINSLNK